MAGGAGTGGTGLPEKNGGPNGGGNEPSGNGGNIGGGMLDIKLGIALVSAPSGGNCFGSGHLKFEKSLIES